MKAKTWAAMIAVTWWRLHGSKPKRARPGKGLTSHVKQAHELRVVRYREGRERMASLLDLFPVVTP